MKIGLLACLYGQPEYLEPCLRPWIEAKNQFNLIISAVHGQFIEYSQNGIPDNDRETLKFLLEIKEYSDYLYIQNNYWQRRPEQYTYATEAKLRNEALKPLLEQGCDLVYLLDLDEFYTNKQITKIFDFIDKDDNQFFAWFSTPMKNYIFDGKQYINGFCPPRAFRTKIGSCKLTGIYFDNDCEYINGLGQKIDYKTMPSRAIPQKLINGGIKHMTWTHENGASKEAYQRKHFNGICSYKFNHETKKLEFDLEHYRKYSLPLPEIHYDE